MTLIIFLIMLITILPRLMFTQVIRAIRAILDMIQTVAFFRTRHLHLPVQVIMVFHFRPPHHQHRLVVLQIVQGHQMHISQLTEERALKDEQLTMIQPKWPQI